MFSDTDGARRADPAATKEIKVSIPVQHHIRLHSIKVLHGTQISESVTEALTKYFRDIRPEVNLDAQEAGMGWEHRL